MKKNIRLDGLVAAVFTPMNTDGSLNPGQIDAYADYLVRAGVQAIFVCGTTGEGQSLSTAERMLLAERWLGVMAGQMPVVIHVGHTVLSESRALSEHAEKKGASAIAALAPYFFKPGVEELVDFLGGIAAAAPSTPFYYYHMPSMTGVSVPVTAFLNAADGRIPTLAGVKFTFEDLMDLQTARQACGGRYEILFGRDEILLAGLALGCTGAVGSTYNAIAPVYQRVIAAFEAGDMETACREQQRAVDFIAVMCRHGGMAANKAILSFAGVDCGPVRLPLRDLNAEQRKALRSDLEKAGFSF